MPRNAGRLDAPKGNTTPVLVEEKKSILDFVTPTEFVEIPTKGRFYPDGHPLHNVETIEIRHMTAKETDILTSKSLLKKGIAIDRMLENVIVDQNIKVNDLFVGDKNALIVASRINGFGNDYETKVTCASCGETTKTVFDLNEVNVKELDEETNISEGGTFVITLPKTGVEAECRLIDGHDEKRMVKGTEKKKKLNLPDTSLTDQLKFIIVSLNGETDRGLVEKFIDLMPAMDSNYLRKQYERVSPNVDMKNDFTCSSCGAEAVIDIPFSTSFFWPD